MREIVALDLPIVREEVSKAEAEALYEDNPYKTEIIEGLEDGEISVYKQGDFFDLCSGPHVPSTGRLGAFKLQNIAGAYWRGDEKNPMLTRVYGTAWPTEKELKAYLRRLEEAKARDHRKIGKDLDLFTFSPDTGAGIPLFLPKGEMMRHLMEDYVREVQTRYDDEHVFCTEDQIQDEFARALEIVREVLDTYGFADYRVQLSLRDQDVAKYVADDAKWSRAEKELREALDTAAIAYDEEAGEAAFYGPK